MIELINAEAGRIPLADNSVHCVPTSPPYWGLRDYGLGNEGIGLEPTIELYVSHLVDVFREVRRVLHPSGVVFLNLGDAYSQGGGAQVIQTKRASYGLEGLRAQTPNLPSKQLLMIPARVALALQADGWWLRSQIIWHKPNCMPESVTDRPTTAHEYVFLLAKSGRYFYDQEAVRETGSSNSHGATEAIGPGWKWQQVGNHSGPLGQVAGESGRNHRTVWTIPTQPYAGAHFATWPPALVEPMIKAGSSERGVCPECGGPWERVVERETADITNPRPFSKPGNEQDRNDVGRIYEEKISITTGWRPTCACHVSTDELKAELGIDDIPDEVTPAPIPATVLDPFCGSGTTLQVARQLGRRGIGLDLSYDYLHDQARERLGLTAWDAWHNGKNGTEGEPLEALPLFEGLPNLAGGMEER